MKRSAVLLSIVCIAVLACSSEQPAATGTTDTRESIATLYVGVPELKVHAKPQDGAPVVGTYQSGESVSVLAEQGEWAEIRTGDTSGWVRRAELATAEQKQASDAVPTPKFEKMPMPVTAPTAKGEIYFEADVNTDGEVVAVKVLHNTTGTESLAAQNGAALRAAKFYPIVVDGERKPFKYYHRVSY